MSVKSRKMTGDKEAVVTVPVIFYSVQIDNLSKEK